MTADSPSPSPLNTPKSKDRPSFFARHAVTIRWASVGLMLIALLLFMGTLPTKSALGVLQNWIEGLGIWGPLALGLLYIVGALLFVPGTVLTLAAGAIFGLGWGMVIVSLASTTAAALAFLIARYVAREKVRRQVEQSPKLTAVDRAIGEQGWKIVALLRLSPAVPFNLQNYLYGVTSIRFWPCVLTSWLAMLPGTFLYVYAASLAKTAAAGRGTSWAKWTLRGIGGLAILVATVYVARLARKAIQEMTAIEPSAVENTRPSPARGKSDRLLSTLLLAGVAVTMLGLSLWAFARKDAVKQFVEHLLGAPPSVTSVEAYQVKPHGPTFDHSTFDVLLKKHVHDAGWVDSQGLRKDSETLDRYLAELKEASFEPLGRNEKLALLINAYNAFTLRLILDHWPVDSIQDIPKDKRWETKRWQVGSHVWSLNQMEHEQIRPKFREPRIHFALICAAIGCPPLRNEAYTGKRIEEQLADQAEYVHSHPRWFRFEPDQNVVHLTKLYDWYGSDFTQYAPSVLDYAARYVPKLKESLAVGRTPKIRWLEYDWRLNSRQNKEAQ